MSSRIGVSRVVVAAVVVAAWSFGLLAAAGDAPAAAAPWARITKADGLPSDEVQFVRRDGDTVWVGSLGGLTAFRAGAPQTLIKGEAVWDLLPVGKGSYWVGTARGILRLDGTTSARRLTGYSVGRLAPFGAKTAWAVADREDRTELLEEADGKWHPAPHFPGKTVADLFVARNGTVWVVMEADGVVAADPTAPPAKWAAHLGGIKVTSFCEDKDGRIWCGTWGRGVMRYDGQAWQAMLEKEEAPITTLKQDGAGHLWAATNANGLWQYDGTKWTNHLRADGSINLLEVPADGRVYLSCQTVGDLRLWTGTAWATVVPAPAMFRALAAGPDGKLWAGHTLTGLYRQP